MEDQEDQRSKIATSLKFRRNQYFLNVSFKSIHEEFLKLSC